MKFENDFFCSYSKIFQKKKKNRTYKTHYFDNIGSE